MRPAHGLDKSVRSQRAVGLCRFQKLAHPAYRIIDTSQTSFRGINHNCDRLIASNMDSTGISILGPIPALLRSPLVHV